MDIKDDHLHLFSFLEQLVQLGRRLYTFGKAQRDLVLIILDKAGFLLDNATKVWIVANLRSTNVHVV